MGRLTHFFYCFFPLLFLLVIIFYFFVFHFVDVVLYVKPRFLTEYHFLLLKEIKKKSIERVRVTKFYFYQIQFIPLQSFDYTELCQPTTLLDANGTIPVSVNTLQRVNLHASQSSPTTSIGSQPSSRSRPWHDFGRQNDADKIQIPKM